MISGCPHETLRVEADIEVKVSPVTTPGTVRTQYNVQACLKKKTFQQVYLHIEIQETTCHHSKLLV